MSKKASTASPKQDATQDLISSLKEKGGNLSIDRFTVVKRNGSIVPFRRERIKRAIDLAFHDTKKIPFETPLTEATQTQVENVTDQVIELLLKQASKGASLTVEGIQAPAPGAIAG